MTTIYNLDQFYFNPVHPAAFGGVIKLYKAAKQQYPDITLSYVKNWLNLQNTYTLHKQTRNKFLRNKYLVTYIDEQWQCDLIDMRQYSRFNKGYKYILTIIDCFSKYLIVFPLKIKSKFEIIKCFKKLFKKRKPIKLQSDRGGEFDNNLFRNLCRINKVNFFTTKDVKLKCAIIERANKTLKSKIITSFTKYGKKEYISNLQNFVNSYNESFHRSIKMKPNEVNKSTEKYAFKNIFGVNNLNHLLLKQSNKPNIKSGDTVRTKYDLNRLEKSYYPLWTDRTYIVDKVLNKSVKPMYVLQDNKRRYYPEELQKINNPEKLSYRIEKILRKRTVNGEKQVLVKWINHPSSYNQWIPATQLIQNK
jgi:Integrase core domain/Chromo (CHRromatin Organisation MOdifier) domain